MKLRAFGSLALAGTIIFVTNGNAFAAQLAKPQTPSERYYAQRNIAQDSDSGALPPRENALAPEPDTADAVPNPRATLQFVPVKSRDGLAIGRVETVDVASNGHARALKISVGDKTVALRADQVLYDPSQRVAFAPFSRDAIFAMATGEGVTASTDPRLY